MWGIQSCCMTPHVCFLRVPKLVGIYLEQRDSSFLNVSSTCWEIGLLIDINIQLDYQQFTLTSLQFLFVIKSAICVVCVFKLMIGHHEHLEELGEDSQIHFSSQSLYYSDPEFFYLLLDYLSGFYSF